MKKPKNMGKKVKKQMSVEEFDKLTLGGFHTLPYGVTENPNKKQILNDLLINSIEPKA